MSDNEKDGKYSSRADSEEAGLGEELTGEASESADVDIPGASCEVAESKIGEMGDSASENADISGESSVEDHPGVEPSTEIGARIKRVNKKVYAGLGMVAAVLIVFLLFGTHTICFHDWQDATCTQAKTCAICGKEDGDPLGHDYSDATCVEPRVCRRCGDVNGDPLGHEVKDWTVTKAATCTSEGEQVGTCVRCGEKQIQSIQKVAHEYGEWVVDQEPTCAETGMRHATCLVCGEEKSETLKMTAHTPGEWTVTKDVTVTSSGNVIAGQQSQVCTVCGKVLETKSYTITLSASQKNALRTAGSYLKYMAFSYSGLVDQLEFEGYSHDDAVFAVDHCGADWYEQAKKSAESYLKYMPFSHSGLVDQLVYEGFSYDQAEHGVTAAGL